MTSVVVLASSLLAVLLAVALLREIRLRRALQKLLSKLLTFWRTHANHPPSPKKRRRDDRT